MTEARSVYVASPEGHTGKSVIALGLVDLLLRRVRKVGVFRPITRSRGDRRAAAAAHRARGRRARLPGVRRRDLRRRPRRRRCGAGRHRRAPPRGPAPARSWSSSAPTTPMSLVPPSWPSTPASPPTWERRCCSWCGPTSEPPATSRTSPRSPWRRWPPAHATTLGVVANRCDPEAAGGGRPPAALGCRRALPRCRCSARRSSPTSRALDGQLLFGDEALLAREAEGSSSAR